MSRKFATVEAAKEEATRLGAAFSCQKGKKRIIGVVTVNGKCKKIAISMFCTDPRVLNNIRENVRHAVRELSN